MNILRRALNSANPGVMVIKGPGASSVRPMLAMESVQMDMVEMQRFAVDMAKRGLANTTNPNLGALKQRFVLSESGHLTEEVGENAGVLYVVGADHLDDSNVEDLTRQLKNPQNGSRFVLLMDPPSVDDVEAGKIANAMECMVQCHGGSTFASFEAYLDSL